MKEPEKCTMEMARVKKETHPLEGAGSQQNSSDQSKKRRIAMRINRRTVVQMLLLSLLMASNAVYAGTRSGEEIEQEPAAQKRSGVVYLPILFYTPETKIGGGALVNYHYRESGKERTSRPSTLMPSLIYTQKKQAVAQLITDLYWRNETYNLKSYTGYIKFPDTFYGIGHNTPEDMEENFTSRSARLEVSFQKKVRSGWHVGVQYDLIYSKLLEVEEGGLLTKGTILGSEEGTASGAGAFVNWDTRNNIFYPSSGRFYQVRASAFGRSLGSDYRFNTYNLDFRQYCPLFSSHVLAFQGYLNLMSGDPPFQLLSLLGGQEKMRGCYEGRYRDKNMMVFQMEYRIMPVWRRFGLVGFVGFGDVSDEVEHFALKDFKHAVGGGIRYKFSPEEEMNLRLDFGYGKDSSGMYITIGEAF